MYYCTFTCFNWLPLIEITKSYDIVYNWFTILKTNKMHIVAYIIMPNHIHCIIYFPEAGFNLNKIIGNGKRFMAYEIINRLEKNNRHDLLHKLSSAVTANEKRKDNCTGCLKTLLMPKRFILKNFAVPAGFSHNSPHLPKTSLA